MPCPIDKIRKYAKIFGTQTLLQFAQCKPPRIFGQVFTRIHHNQAPLLFCPLQFLRQRVCSV